MVGLEGNVADVLSSKVFDLTFQGPDVKDGLDGLEEAAGSDVMGAKKNKRKNKKGKKQKHNVKESRAFPSQPVVEAKFPWKTVVKPKRGRCAVATRVLKAGEVVMAERALAFLPREEYHASVCHHCCAFLEESEPKTSCSGCAFAVYCQKCKDRALKAHRKSCSLARAIPAIAEKDNCDIGLLRLIVKLAEIPQEALDQSVEANVASEEEQTQGVYRDGAVWPSIQDAMALETHKEHMPARWRESVRKACKDLQQAARDVFKFQNGKMPSSPATPAGADWGEGSNQEEPLGSPEVLEHLAALINTNAHGMGAHGPLNTDVALGIFPFVSILNHSCRPNCTFASEGNVMYVRATQDVPQGAELCVSYINLYEPRILRQETLLNSKHFRCSCERCSEPIVQSVDRFLEGVLCNAKGCKGMLLRSTSIYPNPPSPSSWECDSCHRVVDPAVPVNHAESASGKAFGGTERPWDVAAKAREGLVAALVPYRERRFKEARAGLDTQLREFSGKLHPLHVLLFDARTPLMNCCRTAGDAAEGIRQCQAVVEAMEAVVPGQILEQANFFSCLAEMYAERASEATSTTLIKRFRKQAQEMQQKVDAIHRICLGRS